MTTVKVLIMKYCKLTAGGYFMLFHASQKQPPEQWLKLLPRVSVQVWSGFTVVFWQFHKNLHTSKIQMNVYENARCGVALYFPTQLLAFIILNQDGIKKINRDKNKHKKAPWRTALFAKRYSVMRGSTWYIICDIYVVKTAWKTH